MEKSMSRLLIESVVKQALKSIKDSPERGIRNLVDMALQFCEGRFQKHFFTTAQAMLQNEASAYYALVRNIVSNTDTERIFTFGMNLGYNGCTEGARRIRHNEKENCCNIPWAIPLQFDAQKLEENIDRYDTLIDDGENLGIYTWMLFVENDPGKTLLLAKHHPDSAFCIFCEPEDLSAAFLDEVTDYNNIMLVVRYEENADDLYATLRNMGLLYSVWYQYGQQDTEIIINGDLFSSTQQCSPAFTVLVPEEECLDEIRRLFYQTVKRVRNDQNYSTIVWEIQGDNQLIDTIISGDTHAVYFDKDGNLCGWKKRYEGEHHNLFQSSLIDILTSCCPKKVGEPV